MRWKPHVRFEGRTGETHPVKAGQIAPVRPLHLREDPQRLGLYDAYPVVPGRCG